MKILLILSILLQLDSAVTNREAYLERRLDRIDASVEQYSLVSGEQQSAVALQLCDLYYGYDNDSAIVWAKRSFDTAEAYSSTQLQQRAVIAFSRCLDISGEYAMAYQLLNPYESVIYENVASDYYKTLYQTSCWQAKFSTLPQIREKAEQDKQVLLKAVIRRETDPVGKSYYSSLLHADSVPESVIDSLLPLLEKVNRDSEYWHLINHSLGCAYRERYADEAKREWRDSAIYYLAEAAISTIEDGGRGHSSLRELALILYQTGDIVRAYDYMNCCMEDARRSKAHLFAVQMAGDMPEVLVAYEQHIHQQESNRKRLIAVLSMAAVVLLLLLILLSLMFRRYNRANRQLMLLNSQLQQVNDALKLTNMQLTNASRIRDTYVTRYMTDCSSIIESMDMYRKELLHVSLSEQPKKLFLMLKTTEATDEILHTFYQHFDEAFLSIFPDFIQQFNELLRPEEAYAVSGEMQLTTELRIYALIRLGITDSEHIAKFLRLSVKTVQNNRALVRNRALGDRNQLEQKVMQIGIIC